MNKVSNDQNQLGLFGNPPALTGEELKAEGQRIVESNSNADFLEEVDGVIKTLATSGRRFTSDDVRIRVSAQPHHPNSWGAAFSRAAKAGIIRRVGFEKSHIVSRHAGVVATWEGIL